MQLQQERARRALARKKPWYESQARPSERIGETRELKEKSDRGDRDAPIWENAIRSAQTSPEVCAFVSANATDFFDETACPLRCHPDLIEVMTAAGLDPTLIAPYRSLQESNAAIIDPTLQDLDEGTQAVLDSSAFCARLAEQIADHWLELQDQINEAGLAPPALPGEFLSPSVVLMSRCAVTDVRRAKRLSDRTLALLVEVEADGQIDGVVARETLAPSWWHLAATHRIRLDERQDVTKGLLIAFTARRLHLILSVTLHDRTFILDSFSVESVRQAAPTTPPS